MASASGLVLRYGPPTAVVVGLFALFSPGVVGEDTGSLARHMPPGAVAFVETTELGPVIGQIQHSEYVAKVLDSEQFRAAAGTPDYRKAQAARQILETQLGMDLWQAGRKLLGGRLALGVYPPSGRRQPDVLALLRIDDEAAFAQFKERLEPFFILAEDQLDVSESIEGSPLLSVAGQAFISGGEGWVAAATSRDLLSGALRLMQGSEKRSLANDEAFLVMVGQMGEAHLAKAYVNTEAIRAALGTGFVPEKIDNALASLLGSGILELVGDSPYAGMTVDADEAHFRVTAAVAAHTQELDEPHQAFFSDPASSGTPGIPQVPGAIAGFSIYRDVATWYRHREEFLDARVLPEFDKFETGLGNLLPGKNFGEDVLPLFGNTLTFVAAPQDYADLEGEPGIQLPGFAILAEMSEPREAADVSQLLFQTLTTILNLQASQQGREPWVMDQEEHHGVAITYGRYLKKPSGSRLPIAYNFAPAMALVGDRLVVSSSVSLCRDLIDDLQTPSAETDSSTANVPENRNMVVELYPNALADSVEANHDYFLALLVRQGRPARAARAQFEQIIDIVRSLDTLSFSTTVGAESFQIQAEGGWK